MSRSHKPRKRHCDDIIRKEEGGEEQRGIKVEAWKKKELSLGHPEEPNCLQLHLLSVRHTPRGADTLADTVKAPRHPFQASLLCRFPNLSQVQFSTLLRLEEMARVETTKFGQHAVKCGTLAGATCEGGVPRASTVHSVRKWPSRDCSGTLAQSGHRPGNSR